MNNVLDVIAVIDGGYVPTDNDVAVTAWRRGQLARKVLRRWVHFLTQVTIKHSALTQA